MGSSPACLNTGRNSLVPLCVSSGNMKRNRIKTFEKQVTMQGPSAAEYMDGSEAL